jgi:hypothetical protein
VFACLASGDGAGRSVAQFRDHRMCKLIRFAEQRQLNVAAAVSSTGKFKGVEILKGGVTGADVTRRANINCSVC